MTAKFFLFHLHLHQPRRSSILKKGSKGPEALEASGRLGRRIILSKASTPSVNCTPTRSQGTAPNTNIFIMKWHRRERGRCEDSRGRDTVARVTQRSACLNLEDGYGLTSYVKRRKGKVKMSTGRPSFREVKEER